MPRFPCWRGTYRFPSASSRLLLPALRQAWRLSSGGHDSGWKIHYEYLFADGSSGSPGAQGWQGQFSCSLQEQQALPTAPYIQPELTERLYPAPADTPRAGLEAQTTGQEHPMTLVYIYFFFPCIFVLDTLPAFGPDQDTALDTSFSVCFKQSSHFHVFII